MLKRFYALFVRKYLTADLRSLAAGRLALAFVLLLDLIKRWQVIDFFYTNDGLVPNHTMLWRPVFAHSFSFFWMASYTHEAHLAFVVCLLAYSALLLGFRTRLAQVASWLCLISLHGRLLIFDNGGDVVLGLLTTWTMFLPTGRRFSVDAVLERRRARLAAAELAAATAEPAPAPAEPAAATAAPTPAVQPASGDDGKAVSLGVLAVVFQLAAIYFFNAANKSGSTWHDGSAVHYALNLDRLVTWFGVWLREHMSDPVCRVLSYSALGTEAALPVLLLSPIFVRPCRWLAILAVIGLHSGFGVCMNLGVFVPAMIAYTPNLLQSEDWDALARWWHKSERRAAWLTRMAARLSTPIERAAELLSPGRCLRVAEPGRWALAIRRRLPVLRELTAVFFMFVAGNQLLDENPAAHRVWDHHNSPPVAALVTYLNLFQGWVMFAPDAPMGDLNLSVDATTSDGRHVDPFNEAANPRYPLPGKVIPSATGTGWLFYGYVNRLLNYPAYNQALQEWILRYPERTGNPKDRLRRFEVSSVEDTSPPLGQSEATNLRTRLILHYP